MSGPTSPWTGSRTVIHLLRHGEVENPRRILYGRLPGYHLSDRGRLMAERARDHFTSATFAASAPPVTRVVSSPMERAQETAAPLAQALGVDVPIDENLIEADSVFEGLPFGVGDGALTHPRAWWHLRNPFRPSWGEPYAVVAKRMFVAVDAARRAAPGTSTVLVSHQMPIWIARLHGEGRRLWHNPARRQCALASVTSLHYERDRLVLLSYAQPAAELLPGAVNVAGA